MAQRRHTRTGPDGLGCAINVPSACGGPTDDRTPAVVTTDHEGTVRVPHELLDIHAGVVRRSRRSHPCCLTRARERMAHGAVFQFVCRRPRGKKVLEGRGPSQEDNHVPSPSRVLSDKLVEDRRYGHSAGEGDAYLGVASASSVRPYSRVELSRGIV